MLHGLHTHIGKKVHHKLVSFWSLSGGNFDTRGLVGPQEGDLIPPASWVKYPLIAGAGCVLTVTFTMPALPEKATWVLYLSAKKHALLAKNVLVYSVYSFCSQYEELVVFIFSIDMYVKESTRRHDCHGNGGALESPKYTDSMYNVKWWYCNKSLQSRLPEKALLTRDSFSKMHDS